MPKEIMILLIISGIGMVGSLSLLILTTVLGKKKAAKQAAEPEESFEAENAPEEGEAAEALPEESAKEVVFTPLDKAAEEKAAEDAAPAAEPSEPVTAKVENTQPEKEPETIPVLQLVDPTEGKAANSTVVGGIELSIGNAQDIGARPQQQDAFAITPLEEKQVVDIHGVMAVVCDGMGGMEHGAEAANLGAVTFMREYLEAKDVYNETLADAVYAANSEVYQSFQGKSGVIAGTTLVAASILPDGLRFVSVGDSHLYLYRNGKLYQLNRDHNYFAELLEQVKAGNLTLEEAQHHPERAHLTSYVGIEKLELVDYNIEPVALRAGDRVLLCSDGLFKTLSIREITACIENSEPFAVQDTLLEAVKAKAKRRQDNVTVVVLYCDAAV